MPGPLDGVRMLEFTHRLAGPWAGLHLADLGAEVIKLEPPGGSSERPSKLVPNAEDRTFTWLNRGKRSVAVDLERPAGRAVMSRLAARADAAIVNVDPKLAARLGFHYEGLAGPRPDIVYCRITGYGPRGPWALRDASDIEAQSFAGTTAVVGVTDEFGAPLPPTVPLSELLAGQNAAIGLVTALFHRRRSGEGQIVDVSLAGSAMGIIGHMVGVDPLNDALTTKLLLDKVEQVQREGGAFAAMLAVRNAAPVGKQGHGAWYGGYAAKDGGISVGCLTPATRRSMRRALGITGDDIDDPNFNAADPASVALLDELNARLREIMRTKTVREWLDLFEHHGVPAAPVHFPELLADDPQAALNMIDLDHPTNGRQRQVGPFFLMTGTPPAVQGPSPRLGEHTDLLLREAAYSQDEIDALRKDGTIA